MFLVLLTTLASEVVFVKMPLRLRKRKAKRREEYLLNRDYELESSRVRYDADAEQRRASTRDMYRANLESNRASKRWQQEKNSVAVRASKKRRYELNSDEKRTSKRESLHGARVSNYNGTAANAGNITVNIVLLGNKRGNYNGWILSYNRIQLLLNCTTCIPIY